MMTFDGYQVVLGLTLLGPRPPWGSLYEVLGHSEVGLCLLLSYDSAGFGLLLRPTP